MSTFVTIGEDAKPLLTAKNVPQKKAFPRVVIIVTLIITVLSLGFFVGSSMEGKNNYLFSFAKTRTQNLRLQKDLQKFLLPHAGYFAPAWLKQESQRCAQNPKLRKFWPLNEILNFSLICLFFNKDPLQHSSCEIVRI